MRAKLPTFLLLLSCALSPAQVKVMDQRNVATLGHGLLLKSPGYDVDAALYFNRAGVTNFQERKRISDFVRGLKTLGVWSSFHEIWTFRSSQNAGTASIAYGLKGISNGTLAGSPQWSASGIIFDGVDDRITVSGANAVYQNAAGGWIFAVCQDSNPTGGGASHVVFLASSGSGATFTRAGISTRQTTNVFTAIGRRLDADSNVVSSSANSGSRVFLEARANWAGGNVASVVNGSAQTPANYSSGAGSTSNTASQAVSIGGLTDGSNPFPGTISAVGMATVLFTAVQTEQIRALYKSTIGAGLGLP